MTETFTDVRDDFLAYVRRQLVGPFDGEHEVVADTPNRRYLMGILFPRHVDQEAFTEQEGEETEQTDGSSSGGDEDMFSDTSVSSANDFLPASQGFSFFTSADRLQVTVGAARYETLEGEAAEEAVGHLQEALADPTEQQDRDPRRRRTRRVWRRHPLEPDSVTVTGPSPPTTPVLEGRADLHVRWRAVAGGALVTVTVVNSAVAEGDVKVDRLWDQMLLQTEITVVVENGAILEYPSLAAASHDPEEEELRLQHSAARTYAIGHGCAVRWPDTAHIDRLWSDVMPAHEVARVTADADYDDPAANQALDLHWLADRSVPADDLRRMLLAFVDQYRTWTRQQRELALTLPAGRRRDAAERILQRVDTALDRMDRGVELLAHDADVLLAFRLANQAMLMQMRHSASDLAGARRSRAEAAQPPDDYAAGPRWRPFQLGFALLILTGLIDETDDERGIVDLIWFPTGGGKTEAYLLMAAVEIFHRRIRHGDRGAGTTVVSRYTLTLLTTQQFQRTATTICACEQLRRQDPELLGDTPISIGLWVGDSMTPNRYSTAHEAVEALREANQPDNRFVLERCPWCGTEIVPRNRSEDVSDYGLEASDTSFRVHCTNDRCSFHDRLPVHVVDDDVYEHPPTFLLGTVDKFAGLAWEPRSGVFFGRPSNRIPPSLVIQDELHLITGPLGTTVGLYEAAIQRLCEHDGRPPKVVSSTATIRRAPEQVLGLFGRDVHLFPPSGLSADDSHFAKADHDIPGRLYVGLMAQGHTSDTATVHTTTALLQAPVDLQLKGAARDVYWTVIAYHSSLRELGRTVTMARDDVPSRLTALVRDRQKREFDVEEITSNVDRALQPELLERLNRSCDEKRHLDFVASTNMLSVGVDVPRLGLMLVNGQPKATAEYIQATSRVGRGPHPGLVFGLFRSTRPRDRSHYENFVPYHSALYRFVEPTTVTPWSAPSRDRALHAALVILVRHHVGLLDDDSAGDILTRKTAVDRCIDLLVAVTQAVEPREAARTRAELERLRDDWIARAGEAARHHRRMYYTPQGKGQTNLLKDFGGSGDGWPTLRSMRNVDHECVLDVMKASSGTTSTRSNSTRGRRS